MEGTLRLLYRAEWFFFARSFSPGPLPSSLHEGDFPKKSSDAAPPRLRMRGWCFCDVFPKGGNDTSNDSQRRVNVEEAQACLGRRRQEMNRHSKGKGKVFFQRTTKGTVMKMFLCVAAVGTLYSVGFALGKSRGGIDVDDDGVKEEKVDTTTSKKKVFLRVRKSREVSFYYKGNESLVVPSFWVPTDLTNVEHGDPRLTLCQLDFDGYWRNPTKTPMFRDLMAVSSCRGGRSGSLNKLYEDASKSKTKPFLKPSGFVFHESRVGSTLIANMLGSVPTNLVYSESAPPPAILNHCRDCSLDRKVDLLQKLIALMGNSPFHQRLYFKFQSITVPQMAPLLVAFPETPWLFVYREPVQVMMSHFKHGAGRNAPCLREHRRPRKATADILQVDVSAASRSSPEDYCAAHLAMLCEKALENHDNDPNGLLLNYDTLPGALVHYVLPTHFKTRSYSDDDKRRMLDVANVYSKRRKALPSGDLQQQKDLTWGSDSKAKESAASSQIKAAAQNIMRPRYDLMLKATEQKTKGTDLSSLKYLHIEDITTR